MDDEALRAELLHSEAALASRDPSGVTGGLMGLVADDFLEFGRSGRTYAGDEIRELLDGPPRPVALEHFHLVRLAADVALVTYQAAGANRSSIWVRRGDRWQIRFHQGTSIDVDHARSERSRVTPN